MSHVDDGTLHAYLDGELSPAEARGIDAHLAQCPACRGRVEEERALITRAGDLLALAAPPDRELPPFRAADVKTPARLWVRVRLPLAWAATVVLALGIGTYLGSGAAYRERPVPALAPPVASVAPQQDQSLRFAAADTPARLVRKQSHAEARVPKRAVAPPPASASAIPQAAPEVDRIGLRGALAAPQPAPAPAVGFTLDSARAVLGQDPVVVPGAPIRAVRRDRMMGYAAVVVIEQQLDSNTVIELVQGRPVSFSLDAVAVTAADERADRDSVNRRESRAQAEAPAAKAAARLAPYETRNRPRRRLGNLEIQISGPLPSDSLQKLLQLVRPVKP